MIRIHNTLVNKIEEFKPIKTGEMKMYNCGPTVYDFAHIGNLRAFLTADIVRRTFEYSGYKVYQVMNITDVGIGGDNDEGEDKIIKGLRRENKEISLEAMKELTDFYTERFKEDISKLNILTPNLLPRASEHILDDIEMIKKLEEKELTYKISDGIYFDTSKVDNYGKLGGINTQAESESRIGVNSEKRNQKDFALWKFNSSLGYGSPWGQGFPGWHIECSTMSTKYLGNTFDIHTGGIDLAPIHHNNEIVQSENACGGEFAHYWIHNGFVNIKDDKMAKSEGNSITIKSLVDKGFNPLSYRYFLLMTHYRTPTNFSDYSLGQAQNAFRNIKDFFESLPNDNGNFLDDYKQKFIEALEDDFHTPKALTIVWDLIKHQNINPSDKRATLLDFDKVLGLNISNNEFSIEHTEIPAKIRFLFEDREIARKNKDYTKSDDLRKQIEDAGYTINDTEKGPILSPK